MICKSCQIYKRRGRLRSFGPVKLPPPPPPVPPSAGHQNSSSPLLHFSYLSFPLCLLAIRTRRGLCNRCKFTKQSQTSFRKVRTQYFSISMKIRFDYYYNHQRRLVQGNIIQVALTSREVYEE